MNLSSTSTIATLFADDGSRQWYGRSDVGAKDLGLFSAETKGTHMTDIAFYVLLGVVAGIFSGLIGIGGGVIIVPALVFLFGLSQHEAQGTTLGLLVPPIGLPAA
jgi:hypothetical protein